MAEENSGEGPVESPPVAPAPVKEEESRTQQLRELAEELKRSRSRTRLMEYLRLRRSLRI